MGETSVGFLSQFLLDFADLFLDLALDLLTRISFNSTDHIVGLAFYLFDFSGGSIFPGHIALLC